eukprot:scaffold662_cov364-Pavlova_lutheri.AAC.35
MTFCCTTEVLYFYHVSPRCAIVALVSAACCFNGESKTSFHVAQLKIALTSNVNVSSSLVMDSGDIIYVEILISLPFLDL